MSRARARRGTQHPASIEGDPLWYKDAIFYEVRVGAFQDADGDGIGDFRGLASRLDYLQDLGVTALWLLPFYPSPLRDDGYDISDYTNIHPDSGSLDDFKHFLREAHRRGLRVITELVLNHTSDQHPWFQRARRAPAGSDWRNFYVWSDSPERYSEARVIFKDFEASNWTWDPLAKAYYWHRFYAHQPDLNYDNPEVERAVLRFLDFWLGLGVDGLRLDAIPYLYQRDGTNCENLPETHEFLTRLRAHVDAKFAGRMLLAEANQWPEEAAAYFGSGNECHMAFHFPLMPRLFMALHMEDRFPIIDILQQTPPIPETSQWALFLRNHDELTLEMVTDEERDYMYRVYAHDTHARINLGIRRRLAPLLGNDRRRMELMNALLFSLPGTPVIYYGDEIGMGDNFYLGDRKGVRTPMQWSTDRNAGFSRANPQRLYLPVIVDPEYHYESLNVESQQNNQHSLLFWMKRLIALRKRHRAFGRGSIEFLAPSNRKVLAFIRKWENERILVVANLSRFVEYVELDLSEYRNLVAVELFGRKAFPAIGDLPYLLTLGPHSFYWFSLEPPEGPRGSAASPCETQPPRLRVQADWNALLDAERASLEAALPSILRTRRWFGGKAGGVKTATIEDAIELREDGDAACLALVRVESTQGGAETYTLPLAFAKGSRAESIRRNRPQSVLAEVECRHGGKRTEGVVHDGLEEEGVAQLLLQAIGRRRPLRGNHGELVGGTTRRFRELRGSDTAQLRPSLLRVEQSNTSIAYGHRLVLKVFRRLGEGTNPELEIGRFLTDRTSFAHTAATAGWLEYRRPRGEPSTLGILQRFVPNEGDAWQYTLEQVSQYFERVLARRDRSVPRPAASVLALTEQDPPALVSEMLGSYVETARLLGMRTADLHRALASDPEDPVFAPEPFTSLYQRSLYQAIRNVATGSLHLLRECLQTLPESVQSDARLLLRQEAPLFEEMRSITGGKISGLRIRCHGDYHLGQILHTGSDFVIIDFEGEPVRSLSERRVKRSPLRDVAGMMRSFDYAVHGWLLRAAAEGALREEEAQSLAPWADFWRQWVSSSFLRAYRAGVEGTGLIPTSHHDLDRLLRVLVLEKAVYELGYELGHRPDWVSIPIRGLLGQLGTRS